jgi:hypothetical protein
LAGILIRLPLGTATLNPRNLRIDATARNLAKRAMLGELQNQFFPNPHRQKRERAKRQNPVSTPGRQFESL